jgi:hypothetical protein
MQDVCSVEQKHAIAIAIAIAMAMAIVDDATGSAETVSTVLREVAASTWAAMVRERRGHLLREQVRAKQAGTSPTAFSKVTCAARFVRVSDLPAALIEPRAQSSLTLLRSYKIFHQILEW